VNPTADAASPDAGEVLPEALVAHLRTSLGAWPPEPGTVTITSSAARTAPGWDGAVLDAAGLSDGRGTVLSVPPSLLTGVPELAGVEEAEAWLLPRLERPAPRLARIVHRWTTSVADLDDAGGWVAPDAPGVPAWLRPFNGGVLVATVDGRHAAGVGIKRHDDHGWEIAVVTDADFRGRGLAARLVAQAARHILSGGAIPLYLHEPDNVASAHVAASVGFPDRGWWYLEPAGR